MKLSLCCISNILAEQGTKFRTMTYKSYSSKSKEESQEKLSEIIQNNFYTSRQIIHHCKKSGIQGYRLSSDLTPVINHPDVNLSLEDLPNFKLIQYQIVRKDGNPDEISSRFFNIYNKLSDGIRKRLVLENNDNANGTWSIQNLHHYYYKTSGIPITFDTLHHSILPGNLTEEEAFNLAYETWNTTPIFHYSEGKNNTRAHEDMATNLPPTYKDVYWDVELKGKDYAILDMLNKCKM